MSPSRFFEAGQTLEELEFETSHAKRNPDRSNSALAIITRYVTSKHIDAVSIKVLLEQKKRKERIFDYIFEHFTRGEKL